MSNKRDYYRQVVPLANGYLRSRYKRTIEGEENVPEEPALYAINHLRFDDSILVASAYTSLTDKPLRFGAKSEYFEGRGIDNKGTLGRTTRWLIEHTGQIPIHRGDPDRAIITLGREVERILDEGESLGLHPEGTRSLDGRLHKFRSGLARIALQNNVPLVPVGLSYTEHKGLCRTEARISFGEPIMPSDFPSRVRFLPRIRAERLSEQLEDAVAQLTGQERSTEFLKHFKLPQVKREVSD
ncbi:MAG: lysophospholipid acyltransferase family protein [Candidatus Saccharimonadales bacterium]